MHNEWTLDSEANAIFAMYVMSSGSTAQFILQTAKEHANDVILIGGHAFQLLLRAVPGRTDDQLMRDRDQPLLIWR